MKPPPLNDEMTTLLRGCRAEGVPGYNARVVGARLEHHLAHGLPPHAAAAVEAIELTPPLPGAWEVFASTLVSAKGLVAGAGVGVVIGVVASAPFLMQSSPTNVSPALKGPSEPVTSSVTKTMTGPSEATTSTEPPVNSAPVDATKAPRASPKTAPRPAASSVTSGSTHLTEVEHLAALRRLSQSNPAKAVALARQGHKDYRGGLLYQEREALLILALGRAGQRTEARRRADIYLKRFPNGGLSAQVRQALEP